MTQKGQGGRRATRTGVLRRPPAKGLPRLQYKLRQGWRASLELNPLWMVLFLLVSTWCLMPRWSFFVPEVEPGAIATRTFIAADDLSVPDESATLAVQTRARDEVLPVYDFDRAVEADLRRQLAQLFEAGRVALTPPVDELAEGETADPAVAGSPVTVVAEPVDLPPVEGEELEDPGADLRARLAEASTLKLEPEQLELLITSEFSVETEDRLAGVFNRVLRQGVVSGKQLLLEHRVRGITVQELPSGTRKTQLDLYRYLDYPEQVKAVVELDVGGWRGFKNRQRQTLVELVMANLTPNLTLNSSETLEAENLAAAGAGEVKHEFRKGEVIVRKGAKVDHVTAGAIVQMAGTRDSQRLLLTGLGTFFMLVAATLLVWLMCGQERRRDRSRERMVNECLILLMLYLLGARFAQFVAEALSKSIQRDPFQSLESYTFAIPLAALALVSVLLYGRNAALVLSLVSALLVGHIVSSDAIWVMMVYALASSLAAVFALDHHQFKQRSVMTRAGSIVGLVNVAALLALKAMSGEVDGGLSQLGFDLICGFAGGLLAAAVASFSVPIFENLFQITTSIKLIELANPNLPILRRLALEAPGTFQHSLAVANLAKSGCEAIDGDSVLINTGALYHDIGKIFRPHYFIENQVPGRNPHDKIQPSMSALILINHVKEGLELAYKSNLPQPILDAIDQHHGTRLIKFFYTRAKERCAPGAEVRESEFRYPGNKPQSKEMGVLMLADAVEAASRTLVAPGRQQIRNLWQALFQDCLNDGQLDDTDLTLGDLHRVEEAFLRVLTNIHHRRVDYPGFDFNRPSREIEAPVKDRASKDAEAPEPAAAPGPAEPAAPDRGLAAPAPAAPGAATPAAPNGASFDAAAKEARRAS